MVVVMLMMVHVMMPVVTFFEALPVHLIASIAFLAHLVMRATFKDSFNAFRCGKITSSVRLNWHHQRRSCHRQAEKAERQHGFNFHKTRSFQF
ncbi:MAG: hypothetical protein V1746_03495 [bacterium]